jgi:hypothetical protein
MPILPWVLGLQMSSQERKAIGLEEFSARTPAHQKFLMMGVYFSNEGFGEKNNGHVINMY